MKAVKNGEMNGVACKAALIVAVNYNAELSVTFSFAGTETVQLSLPRFF